MDSADLWSHQLACAQCGPRQVKVIKFVHLLTAALYAYITHVRLQRDRHLDALEDRLDALAAVGTPSDKLLMERVGQRIERERKRLVRSPDDNS